MPKKKTNKTAAKRVRRTATGKLVFSRPSHKHLLSSKSRKRKRHLRRAKTVNAADHKRISDML
jgi:large subunit ribosomal protein L35